MALRTAKPRGVFPATTVTTLTSTLGSWMARTSATASSDPASVSMTRLRRIATLSHGTQRLQQILADPDFLALFPESFGIGSVNGSNGMERPGDNRAPTTHVSARRGLRAHPQHVVL